jgi:hypothetical protein
MPGTSTYAGPWLPEMPVTAPAYADVAFALKPLKPDRPAVAPPTEPLGIAPRLAVPNVPLKPETVDGGAKLRVVAPADVVLPPALGSTPVDVGAYRSGKRDPHVGEPRVASSPTTAGVVRRSERWTNLWSD